MQWVQGNSVAASLGVGASFAGGFVSSQVDANEAATARIEGSVVHARGDVLVKVNQQLTVARPQNTSADVVAVSVSAFGVASASAAVTSFNVHLRGGATAELNQSRVSAFGDVQVKADRENRVGHTGVANAPGAPVLVMPTSVAAGLVGGSGSATQVIVVDASTSDVVVTNSVVSALSALDLSANLSLFSGVSLDSRALMVGLIGVSVGAGNIQIRQSGRAVVSMSDQSEVWASTMSNTAKTGWYDTTTRGAGVATSISIGAGVLVNQVDLQARAGAAVELEDSSVVASDRYSLQTTATLDLRPTISGTSGGLGAFGSSHVSVLTDDSALSRITLSKAKVNAGELSINARLMFTALGFAKMGAGGGIAAVGANARVDDRATALVDIKNASEMSVAQSLAASARADRDLDASANTQSGGAFANAVAKASVVLRGDAIVRLSGST